MPSLIAKTTAAGGEMKHSGELIAHGVEIVLIDVGARLLRQVVTALAR